MEHATLGLGDVYVLSPDAAGLFLYDNVELLMLLANTKGARQAQRDKGNVGAAWQIGQLETAIKQELVQRGLEEIILRTEGL